jgi:hypothetical protein
MEFTLQAAGAAKAVAGEQREKLHKLLDQSWCTLAASYELRRRNGFPNSRLPLCFEDLTAHPQ